MTPAEAWFDRFQSLVFPKDPAKAQPSAVFLGPETFTDLKRALPFSNPLRVSSDRLLLSKDYLGRLFYTEKVTPMLNDARSRTAPYVELWLDKRNVVRGITFALQGIDGNWWPGGSEFEVDPLRDDDRSPAEYPTRFERLIP